jgi:hypothetical protein
MDVVMLAIALGFFLLTGGLVALCARLTDPEAGR